MKRYLTLWLMAVMAISLIGCGDDGNSGQPASEDIHSPEQTCEDGACSDTDPCDACTPEQTCENGACSDADPCDACTPEQTCENGVCKPQEGGKDSEPSACDGILCPSGECIEGVCVTASMRAYRADDICDPTTFVDFCEKNGDIVYCDSNAGIVIKSSCGKGNCVIYDDTVHGLPARKAACLDGGDCMNTGKVTTECLFDDENRVSTVYATACQQTTRGKAMLVSVDGYYCAGQCNAAGTKCDLVESECHPYEFQSVCDGSTLNTCFMTTSVTAVERREFCQESCTSVGGKAICGLAQCTEAGTRQNICGAFDSTSVFDALDTICVRDDDGRLFQVRTGMHEYCQNGCQNSTGECK